MEGHLKMGTFALARPYVMWLAKNGFPEGELDMLNVPSKVEGLMAYGR
jgi:uncharacterized protein (DUF3820 family)